MKIKFIHPADQELIDAYQYYESQLAGLGYQFLEEFNTIIKLILKYPTLWLKVGQRTRRAILKNFPYIILYVFEEDTVHITCIAHQHRDQEYYIERMI